MFTTKITWLSLFGGLVITLGCQTEVDAIKAQAYTNCLEGCINSGDPMKCDTNCKDKNPESYAAFQRTMGEATGHSKAMAYQDCLERCISTADPMGCDNTCKSKHAESYKDWQKMTGTQ